MFLIKKMSTNQEKDQTECGYCALREQDDFNKLIKVKSNKQF